MKPNLSDAGSKESTFTEEEGGATYFVCKYERRGDYDEQGLSFTINETEDLINSIELPLSPVEQFVSEPVDGFETVTTRYLIGDPAKFIQLEVELTSP